MPDPSGMRYIYRGGLVADRGDSPLAYEPGIFGGDRLLLRTDGEVRRVTPEQLRRALDPEGTLMRRLPSRSSNSSSSWRSW